MSQPPEENSVSIIVIEVESNLTHDSIKIDKFASLRFKVVLEPVLKLLLELFRSICR